MRLISVVALVKSYLSYKKTYLLTTSSAIHLQAVAQIILKLFLESYHSKVHTNQGNIKKHSLGRDRISKNHNLDLGNSPSMLKTIKENDSSQGATYDGHQ